MATFNIELWQQLEEDFLDGKVYFGLAPEDTSSPYCVIHVLDSGDDERSRTLCGAYSGESDIQFNIYATNDMWLDELLQQLNSWIKSYKILDNYRIIVAERGTTKTASGFSSEVGAGFSRFNFKYETL